jgi:hypothetical protein
MTYPTDPNIDPATTETTITEGDDTSEDLSNQPINDDD